MGYTGATDVKSDGVETIKLRASANRTRGDVVKISTGHSDGVYSDATIVTDTTVYRVAVALQDIASGEIGEYAIKGTVDVTVPSGTYTAGNGLHIRAGAVADSGFAAEAPSGETTRNDFAVIQVGGTSVTSVTATLTGDPITGQL